MLHGVDRSGAEYECVTNRQVFDGPTNAASVQVMTSWHINAVRVPLNEDCWLGINGVITGRVTYRNAIKEYVKTLPSFGLYVILDLHLAAPAQNLPVAPWPMAGADHAPTFGGRWRRPSKPTTGCSSIFTMSRTSARGLAGCTAAKPPTTTSELRSPTRPRVCESSSTPCVRPKPAPPLCSAGCSGPMTNLVGETSNR